MTDKTLFIHAGGTKTGSTAIQNFLDINISRLNNLGFAYEHRPNIKSEYEINSGNGAALYKALSTADTQEREIDSLFLSYFGHFDTAICSNEILQFVQAQGWKKLLDSSIRLGVKLKIIFYVRNVIPYLQSAYDQLIKRHGESKSFDDWVKVNDWEHFKALQIISHELPQINLQIKHYDHEKTVLLRSFLNGIGISPSFEVNRNELNRQVNRSLTNEERNTLMAFNKVLGDAYSKELSELLIYANPGLQGEPVTYQKRTEEFLLDRFNSKVEWINKAFFNGQDVVSVLPIKSLNDASDRSSISQPEHTTDLDMRVLGWAIEKLGKIKEETEQRLLNHLYNAALNTKRNSHPDLPSDFDPIAYLLLNQGVLRAGMDPAQHFVNHGMKEGRHYKFPGK